MTEVLTAVTFDFATGEVTERLLTEEEIAENKVLQIDETQRIAKEEAKANGMAKLIALGLTEEEAGALING